jgi:hypothetical protein
MPSATYDKLKALLDQQGKLSADDINKAIAEHGEMTADENVQLEAERHARERSKDQKVTMDEYLAALKVLDTEAEGSDAYKKAEKIVDAYESGG